jgi:N-acetyl sugar amidotransferase
MPDTKPGIVLNNSGICQACVHYENRKNINWDNRWNRLKKLAKKIKEQNNNDVYDCIITVSGGKDSYYQLHILKEKLGLNPLLVTVNSNFSMTKTGLYNLKNMVDVFNCDNIVLNLNQNVCRIMTRVYFEKFGFGSYPMDVAIYSFPVHIARQFNIPFVFYGENVSYEYGGVQQKETSNAGSQFKNTVASPIDLDFWKKYGLTRRDLHLFNYPIDCDVSLFYLSYFVPWDGYHNYMVAKRYGFQNVHGEWKREGYIEDYDQVDTVGYLVNSWLKYPKYGFSRVTDVCGYWLRSGRITRKEAVSLINKYDGILDDNMLNDWLSFTGYTHNEFWDVVEKFWNRDIFEKVDDVWRLKHHVS